MATGDTPTIVPYAQAHSTYTGAGLAGAFEGGAGGLAGMGGAGGLAVWGGGGSGSDYGNQLLAQAMRSQLDAQREVQKVQKVQKEEAKVARRLVQVFIADPDERVPLEQSLLYRGEQKLTDATDQELFFEIDIKSTLDIHNAMRAKIVNKKVKERTEYLDPVKIRDLKMVVVNVATF